MAKLIKALRQSKLAENAKVAEQLRAIAALGYRTVEQFAGAARAAKPAFESYIKGDVDRLLKVLEPEPLHPDAVKEIEGVEYGLGVEISGIPTVPRSATGVFFSETALPGSIDMIAQMPYIRNQNPRGACIAHAALAVFEHFFGKQNEQRDLSEQFLTFLCKENDNLSEYEGSTLIIAFSLLVTDGCCLEQTWPYINKSNPCNWGQGPPPAGAVHEALKFTIPGVAQIPAKDVNAIKTVLASERCVAFSIPAYRSWFCNEEVKLSGNILMPPPGDRHLGGHAMCMVGYRDLPDSPDLGGGEFLIRNSWGDKWGINSAVRGYGTVSYRFINTFCLEAYSIDTN